MPCRAVPTDLYGCEEKEMFLEVLDELSEGGSEVGCGWWRKRSPPCPVKRR